MPGPDEHHDRPPAFPEQSTRSELSGQAGDVVQAHDVSGGVHFHRQEVRSPVRIPRQLPGDVRGFVNRSAELRRLDTVLNGEEERSHAVALLVIDGTAGAGKTSLAVHWAHQVSERFPDGQLYVNLRGYDAGAPVAPDDALALFLRAFNLRAEEVPADLEAKSALYRSLVADRRLLIVLDNAATVGQVRPLLPGSSSCLVLVTSRSRLPGLAVRDGARRVSVGPLSEPDSIALVHAVTVGYRDHDEAGQVRELTRLCAQLPLALRIAAERAASRPRMPLTELIQDLRDESALWDALSTEDDEEASAVRTVFAWSYRALPEGTARLFRLLGLHPGPEFGIQAAAALAASSVRDIRPLLHALTGAHLLEETGRDRYQFHDLLRLYAIDQAHQDDSELDQRAALRRVLTWYLHGATTAVQMIELTRRIERVVVEPLDSGVMPVSFAGYEDALRWYESERGNLLAATAAAADAGFDQIAWQLPAVLGGIYGYRDVLGSWLPAQQVALDAARRDQDRLGEALVLETMAVQYRLLYRFDEATDTYRAALTAFQDIGDAVAEIRSMLGLGLICRRQHNLEEAHEYFQRAMVISRALDDQLQIAVLLRNLGAVLYDLGRPDEAEDHYLRASRIFHATNQRMEESVTLRYLGTTRIELHRLAEARESLSQSLAIARDHDDTTAQAATLVEFSNLELAEDAIPACLASSQQAATMLRQQGHRGHEAIALGITGRAYQRLGRADEAVAFHRRTVAIHRDLDDSWQLAIALDHLATVLAEIDQLAEARDSWQTSLSLIEGIPGSRAEALRANINKRLGHAS